jgi:cytohesin
MAHLIPIEARQEHGATPLACATFDGNTESVKFLLEHGADIEARTNGGEGSETPLLRAVREEHVETAKLLLAKGANVHARWRRLTAVHVAMMGDQLSKRESDKEMVKLLTEKGLELPAIHMAAYSGDLEKVRNYIADGTKIGEKDAAAYTALHCAVCGGHKAIVEFLLSKGADVNAKTTNGWTPLRFAWTVDMAAFLIANGADVRIAGELGDTSLHQAVNRNDHTGDKALIELLLKHGADVNATSVGWEGWTPFHVACRYSAQDIVELLLAHGADVNAKTDKGITPLSLAKESGRQQIVELLRKRGAIE